MNKFEIEKITVKRFLNNQNIDCQDFIFSKKEEPCDVYCENTKQQFQVTWNEHDFQKKIHTTPLGKPVEQKRTTNELINDIIINPCLNKIDQYGKSAREIILLVTYKGAFPKYLNNYLSGARDKIKNNPKNFFTEIYLVCPNENIKIF